MKLIHIAQVAHEINRSYCMALGDDSQLPWGEAPEWQKNSAIEGVQFHLDNPGATASASHDLWMDTKISDGWVYGETKDAVAKTHPCLVPFDQLPQEQQAKDFLFMATVRAISAIPDEPVVTTVQRVESSDGKVPVKYVGKRPSYVDGAYGTRISWNQGETKLVPADKAFLMLKHQDVYELGDAGSAVVSVTKVTPQTLDNESDLQDARDAVAIMDVEALRNYVATNFAGHKLHHNVGLDKARQTALGLIDQYGIPK